MCLNSNLAVLKSTIEKKAIILFKKKKQFGRLELLDFKIYFNDTVIKTV